MPCDVMERGTSDNRHADAAQSLVALAVGANDDVPVRAVIQPCRAVIVRAAARHLCDAPKDKWLLIQTSQHSSASGKQAETNWRQTRERVRHRVEGDKGEPHNDVRWQQIGSEQMPCAPQCRPLKSFGSFATHPLLPSHANGVMKLPSKLSHVLAAAEKITCMERTVGGKERQWKGQFGSVRNGCSTCLCHKRRNGTRCH